MNSEEVKRFTDDEKVSMADEYAEALITVIGADGSEKAYAREDFIMGLNKAESIYIPKIEQLQSDNKRLRDVVEGINGWKDSCEMYANAWARELGGTYPKTHLIDALVVTTRAMKKKLNAFEEVSKKDFR